jgi:hypothetical protein
MHWSTNPMRFKSKGPKFETVGKTAPSEEAGSAGKPPLDSPLASSLACPGAVPSPQSTSSGSAILPIQPNSDSSSKVDMQEPLNNSSSTLLQRCVNYCYFGLLI